MAGRHGPDGPAPWWWRLPSLLLATSVVASSALPASADHRFFRTLEVEDGLDVPDVRSLAQDGAGFLWIGTVGGLHRFDGVEVRRWAPEELTRPIVELTAGPSGELVALDRQGFLFTVTGRGAAPVPGAAGEPITDATHAAFDEAGRLWVVRSGALHVRGDPTGWSVAADPPPGEDLNRVFPLEDRGLFVAGERTVRRLAPDGLQIVAELNEVEDMAPAPGGGLLAMSRMRFWETPRGGGALVRIRDGSVEELVRIRGARGIRLVVRGNTVWASFDRYLVSVEPDGAVSTLEPEDGVPGGGPLLVDAEGSLWLGTYAGLLQFP